MSAQNKKKKKRFIVEERRKLSKMLHPEEEIEFKDAPFDPDENEEETISELANAIAQRGKNKKKTRDKYHPFIDGDLFEDVHRDSYGINFML